MILQEKYLTFLTFKNSMPTVTSPVVTMSTTQITPGELFFAILFILIIYFVYVFYRKKRK